MGPYPTTLLLLLDEQLATFIMRPFLDTLIFRWGIRSIQKWWVQVYGYPQEWSPQTWMVLSSVIYSISHIQTNGLPSLQRYRGEHFHPLPTFEFVSRLVLNALISWGWLCPAYERRGLWASVRAQVSWQALRTALACLPSALRSQHVWRSWSWFDNPHCDDDNSEKRAGRAIQFGNHSSVEWAGQEHPHLWSNCSRWRIARPLVLI